MALGRTHNHLLTVEELDTELDGDLRELEADALADKERVVYGQIADISNALNQWRKYVQNPETAER